jgi:hypothetical protein
MAKVNTTQVNRLFKELSTRMDDLPDAALDEFRKNTPRDRGNARRNTRLDNNTIVADYPYSQRLEEGYSRQAPQGMIEPTEKWIQQEVDRRLKGL